MSVRFGTEFQFAATEHLRLQFRELAVDFETDDRFPVFQNFIERFHVYSSPSANWAATGALP